jgi:hypothetical protein
MRDKNIKAAFIRYLQQDTDERFFQALANFAQLPYIGMALTPDGECFTDLFNIEADKTIDWIGKLEATKDNKKEEKC